MCHCPSTRNDVGALETLIDELSKAEGKLEPFLSRCSPAPRSLLASKAVTLPMSRTLFDLKVSAGSIATRIFAMRLGVGPQPEATLNDAVLAAVPKMELHLPLREELRDWLGNIGEVSPLFALNYCLP